MPDLLEAVEYAAWQLAAEPVEWRMEHLLQVVCESAGDIAKIKEAPRAPVKPESVDLLSMPDGDAMERHPASQDDQDTPDAVSAHALLSLVPDIPEWDMLSGSGEEPGPAAEAAAPADVKACTGCRKTMPLTEFSKDSTRPAGRKSRCKLCVSDDRARRARQKKEAG
jgi:hypothetical protein